MTITELIEEIKWEAKLQSDNSWDAHLILLIWDEMIQIASLQNEESLYVCRQILTAADQVGAIVTMPVMIKLDRIEYFADVDDGYEWVLPDRDEMVAPIPVDGRPKAYEIFQGIPPNFKLSFIHSMALGTDRIYVSYWKYPNLPVGGDTIFPPAWIPSLKANCIRRALIYNMGTADKQAEIFSTILNKAEAVAQKSNEALDISKDEKGSN